MLKLAIVVPKSIYRSGFIQLLNDIQGVAVALAVADVQELLKKLLTLTVDAILLDLELPISSCFKECNQIKVLYPKVKVGLMLSNLDSIKASNCRCSGADWYLTRDIDLHTLKTKLKAVISLGVNQIISITTQSSKSSETLKLSKKDIEVLCLLKSGFTSKQIAQKLCLSKRSVDSRRDVLLRKMDVKNCLEAVHLAICKGLL